MNKSLQKKTLFTIFLLFANCDDITDIFPPSLDIKSPSENEQIDTWISVEGKASDNIEISNIEIYTFNKLGDKWLEAEVSGADFKLNFPIWSQGINKISIKAFDQVGNFKEKKINIRSLYEYDMSFEDVDFYTNWTFSGEIGTTTTHAHSGRNSLVIYGSRSSASGLASVTKNTRNGHVSFHFFRNSGCYASWPEVQFLIDGKIKYSLKEEDGIENIFATDWTRIKIKVGEGRHTFSWKVTNPCSNGNYLFLDSVYLP